MATKDPTDTSAKANALWNDLVSDNKKSLTNLIQGAASEREKRTLEAAIKKKSTLGSQVFADGIAEIDSTAQKKLDKLAKAKAKLKQKLSPVEKQRIITNAYSSNAPKVLSEVAEVFAAEDEVRHIKETVEPKKQGIGRTSIPLGEQDEATSTLFDRAVNSFTRHGRRNEEDEEEDENNLYSERKSKSQLRSVGSVDVVDRIKRIDSVGRFDDDERTRDKWSEAWWRRWDINKIYERTKKFTGGMLGDIAKLAGMAYLFSPTFREWINEKVKDMSQWFVHDGPQKVGQLVWSAMKAEAERFLTPGRAGQPLNARNHGSSGVVTPAPDTSGTVSSATTNLASTNQQISVVQSRIDNNKKALKANEASGQVDGIPFLKQVIQKDEATLANLKKQRATYQSQIGTTGAAVSPITPSSSASMPTSSQAATVSSMAAVPATATATGVSIPATPQIDIAAEKPPQQNMESKPDETAKNANPVGPDGQIFWPSPHPGSEALSFATMFLH